MHCTAYVAGLPVALCTTVTVPLNGPGAADRHETVTVTACPPSAIENEGGATVSSGPPVTVTLVTFSCALPVSETVKVVVPVTFTGVVIGVSGLPGAGFEP